MAAQQVSDNTPPSRRYVFGPVPSRRLGQSLGIDTIPLKTCNWNCVYCQLGRSEPLINQRQAYFPREAILAETRAALVEHKPGEIDWITFVGSGEPTLHSDIGWLIGEVKKLTETPVAVITNGSLLYRADVRAELARADAIMPTLDAGNPELYRKINRPWPELTYETLVEGLRAFRAEYAGKLWIEVMLMKGLNDSEGALHELARVMQSIGPDQVHLLLPTRPPVETWVQPADEEGVLRATAILGEIAEVLHPIDGSFDLSGFEDPVDGVVAIITRHPMRENQIRGALAAYMPAESIDDALARLLTSGRAQVVQRYGVRFWSAAPAHYPDSEQSQRTQPKV
jgi:wyosine [tRNA(Phe)-imidazoG37] synthetase (radical SAM superfamily)